MTTFTLATGRFSLPRGIYISTFMFRVFKDPGRLIVVGVPYVSSTTERVVVVYGSHGDWPKFRFMSYA